MQPRRYSNYSAVSGIIVTRHIGDGQITAAKRGNGFASGIILGSTLSTTGNKSVTGLGFKPRLVKFFAMPSTGTVGWNDCVGRMTTTSQSMSAKSSNSSGANANVNSNTTNCFGWITAGSASSTLLLAAQYVSMDSDGFTVNVSVASSAVPFIWEAYA